MFVVEQGGKIKILQNGSISATPFLDISSKITTGGEMGLLGVTFHRNFAAARKLYVNYVRTVNGQIQSVIAEYTISASDSNQVDITSERILLTVDQIGNFSNHKAGQLAFGPDGFLYFGLRACRFTPRNRVITGGKMSSFPVRTGDFGSSWVRVSANYFETIGTPIVRGRGIGERDTATSQKLAVINEAFARKFFPNEDPLGKHFGKNEASHAGDY